MSKPKRHFKMTIDIYILEDDTGRVEINCDADEFLPWMMAAEYLTFATAQESGAGFEKALELIQEGAFKYKTVYRKGQP